jgi:chromosome segregation ATPase
MIGRIDDEPVAASGGRTSALEKLASTQSDLPGAPSTLSTWRGQSAELNAEVNTADQQRRSTSEQLKNMLEENLRLKMTSETIKDELSQKGAELESRAQEAHAKKGEVSALQTRASAMDNAYREKVNELRRYSNITDDLKQGIDRTDEELLRAEGDLQVKSEVAVRMKAKIDEMLVEIERVSAANEAKSQELDSLKSEAIALGSKHQALMAEQNVKSEEVSQWSEEKNRLESGNAALEDALAQASGAISSNTAEVARLNEGSNENDSQLRALNKERERLQRTVDVAQANFDETAEEKANVESQVNKLTEELDSWQNKLSSLESESSQQRDLINSLEHECDQCATAEVKFRDEIENLGEKVRAKSDTASNARRNQQEAQDALDQEQASLRRMDREVLESTAEVSRLKDLSASLKTDNAEMIGRHQQALDEFNAAEDQQRTLKTHYDAAKAEKENLRDQVDTLGTDNDRWSAILAELRNEIAVLGTEHDSQMETAEEYRAKVDRLKGVLAGKKEVSEKLREQLETEEVNKLEEQIKEQSYLVKAQEDALEARNRMCARLHAESEELQADLIKHRNGFESRQQEIAVLTQTIEDKERELAVLKNESEAFIAEFTKHEANMKKARIAIKIKESTVGSLKLRAHELGEQLDNLEDVMKKTEEEAESGHQLVKTLEAELAWGLEEFESKREQADRYRAKAQSLVTEIAEKREWCGEVALEKERWASETEILGKIVSEVDYELIRRKIEKEAAERPGDPRANLHGAADPVIANMRKEVGEFGADAAHARDEISQVLTECKTLSTELVYREMDLQHAVLEADRWRKRKEELEQRVAATGKDLDTNVEMVNMRRAEANAYLEQIRKSELSKRLAEEDLQVYEEAMRTMEEEVVKLRSEVDNKREELAELGIRDKSPFDVASSEPMRLANELGWIEERLSQRKVQSAQSERQAIIAAEQLDVLKREFGYMETTLKKQIEETERYKQMVADMVGYSTGAADGQKSEVPADLLNDPIVLKYKADAERMRQQVKASDVDIEAQRAELKRWKEMAGELESQVQSRQEELRRVSMDLKVKKEVGMRLKAKASRLGEDINDVTQQLAGSPSK